MFVDFYLYFASFFHLLSSVSFETASPWCCYFYINISRPLIGKNGLEYSNSRVHIKDKFGSDYYHASHVDSYDKKAALGFSVVSGFNISNVFRRLYISTSSLWRGDRMRLLAAGNEAEAGFDSPQRFTSGRWRLTSYEEFLATAASRTSLRSWRNLRTMSEDGAGREETVEIIEVNRVSNSIRNLRFF